MRFAPGLALALAACATAPSAPATTTAPAASPAPGGSDTAFARLLRRAGEADAPTLEAEERRLGEADIARREGAGAMLTYRAESCALVLIFAGAQGRPNALRLAETLARAREAGAPAPQLDACLAAIEARRARS